jgi:Protein of unknown function (DUF2695)
MRSPPPISDDELAALFTFLNRPNPTECTHSHAETIEFLTSRNLPVAETLDWLRVNGGFCDCEIIYNVADAWGEQVGWHAAQDDDGP